MSPSYSSLTHPSTYSPGSPSPMRDSDSNIIPWNTNQENEDPLHGYQPTSPHYTSSEIALEWNRNPTTGLPEREFNIYIDPDNRPNANVLDLGEPLLVPDPLNPGQLITNPRFNPEILRLISAAGRDDQGQINIRVPPTWRVSVGPAGAHMARSGAPSPPRGGGGSSSSSGSSRPSGGQEVRISGPGFVIYEDTQPGNQEADTSGRGFVIHEDGSSGGGSVRDRSNAPATLGLRKWQPQEEEDAEEDQEQEESSCGTPPTHQGSGNSLSLYQGSGSGNGDGNSNGNSSGKGSDNVSGSGHSQFPHKANSNANGNGSGSGSSSSDPSHKGTGKGSRSNSSKSNTKYNLPSKSPPPKQPATQADEKQEEEADQAAPWYLAWETSTVVLLREELRSRGISLVGLRLKQDMIDRLRRDDAENGVGGVYHPSEGEEEAEAEVQDEEGEDDDGEEEEEAHDAKDENGDPSQVMARVEVPATAPASAPNSKPALKRRRMNPFLPATTASPQSSTQSPGYDGSADTDADGYLSRAVKRQAVGGRKR
jgi:hypothetical protein